MAAVSRSPRAFERSADHGEARPLQAIQLNFGDLMVRVGFPAAQLCKETLRVFVKGAESMTT
jgi:hypothetical protein